MDEVRGGYYDPSEYTEQDKKDDAEFYAATGQQDPNQQQQQPDQQQGEDNKQEGGSSEEPQQQQQKPAQPQQQQQEQQPKQQEENPHLNPNAAQAFAGAFGNVGLGVIDTGSNLLGMAGDLLGVQAFKDADAAWDAHNAQYRANPTYKAIQDISGLVIPTLAGGWGLIGKLDKLKYAAKLPSAVRWAGRVAGSAGIDMAVTSIATSSTEDENIAQTVNDWLGWDIPWATLDEDSPDIRRQKHLYEAMGFSFGTDILFGVFGKFGALSRIVSRPVVKLLQKGSGDSVAEGVSRAKSLLKEPDLKNVDEVVYEYEKGTKKAKDFAEQAEVQKALREDAQTKQGVKDQLDNPERYSSYKNEPHELHSRPVYGVDADPKGSFFDNWRIFNNVGTSNGVMRSPVTKFFMQSVMEIKSGTEAMAFMKEIGEAGMSVEGAFFGRRFVPKKEIEAAADALVVEVLGTDKGKFAEQMSKYGGILDEVTGKRLLNEEQGLVFARAFKKITSQYLDQDMLRGTAVLVQDAANNAAISAKAVNLMEGMDTTAQQMNVLENLAVVYGYLRHHKSFFASGLQNTQNFADSAIRSPKQIKKLEGLESARSETQFAESMEKAKELTNTLKEIARTSPEYLRPFMEIYEMTNGEVDKLYKLQDYMSQKVSFLNRVIKDNRENPSLILREMRGVLYNSVLNGLAPVRAAVGNAIMLGVKPMTSLMGAAFVGGPAEVKRQWAAYGSLIETFQRASQHTADEWKFAIKQPDLASMRGRGDLASKNLEEIEAMDAMAEGWAKNGEDGKVIMWNMTKFLSKYNNHYVSRFGTNLLFSIDGFSKSMIASYSSRLKAYDYALEKLGTKSVGSKEFKELMEKADKALYDQAFDATGQMTDDYARFAAEEATLNLDNEAANRISNLTNDFPLLRSIFMFPRTGANSVAVGWSFMPTGPFNLAAGRARKLLNAKTTDEMLDAAAEFGMPRTLDAYRSLKSEYVGRQIMGTAVTMSAAVWALQGGFTGNGPQDVAERQRLEKLNSMKFNSIRLPNGEWVSYKGLEPFTSILGIVGDVVYQSTRPDQAITEDFFRKIGFIIGENITNQTFMSGIQDLFRLGSDPNALSRFLARQANAMLPYAGTRNALSAMGKPGMYEVERNIVAEIRHMNRGLGIGGEGEISFKINDLYTNKPLSDYGIGGNVWNSTSPIFKHQGGTEPWREYLMNTGWDGFRQYKINPVNGEKLTPEQLAKVQNHIASKYGRWLIKQIESIQGNKQWNEQHDLAVASRGLRSLQDLPFESIVLTQLDRAHDRVFKAAWRDLISMEENSHWRHTQSLQRQRDAQQRRQDPTAAARTADEIRRFRNSNPKLQ